MGDVSVSEEDLSRRTQVSEPLEEIKGIYQGDQKLYLQYFVWGGVYAGDSSTTRSFSPPKRSIRPLARRRKIS
jgi:hypothetical protein